MLHEHYLESCNFKELVVQETAVPAWDKYRAIDDAGNLLSVLVYNDDAQCVGYAAVFLSDHPHYEGLKTAWNDVIFLLPKYRTGSAGGRLMKAIAAAAKEAGAIAFQWHAKPNSPLNDVLAKRHAVFEYVYSEPL